jgi:molybdate transport repressor ModE-like protein
MRETHDMDLELTRSLIAVANHGSISDAADAIGLSQPALSRRIQQLEEELGARLVERSGRGVVLTAMGRLAVREGQHLLDRYERLRTSIAEHVRLEAGTVRIGGGATAVAYLLPSAIARFQKSHPTVRFQLQEAGSREVERGVIEERLELGVVTLPVSGAEVDVIPLMRDRIVLVAGSGHPLAQRKRVPIAALAGQSLVGFEAGSAIRQSIDAALRDAGVEMNVVMELRSVAAILQMVETTGSLAFVSELGAGKATVVPVQGLRIERELAVIAKKGRPLSPVAAAFAKGLRG